MVHYLRPLVAIAAGTDGHVKGDAPVVIYNI